MQKKKVHERQLMFRSFIHKMLGVKINLNAYLNIIFSSKSIKSVKAQADRGIT